MSISLLQIYHRLPPPARSLAASLRGFYLRSWRYGPESEGLIAAALEREHWTEERWSAWQAERLEHLLHRAATRVPYYRDDWARRRRNGDRASWQRLEHWPILTKETLRANPRAFVADDRDIRRMFRDSTSGTSGTPLSMYFTRETLRQWYALGEARMRRWHGVSLRQRWAILGGQLVVPFQQTTPPFWVVNAALNQLYLSTHHLSPATAPLYVDALRRYAPTHMVVYPSSAHLLAGEMIERAIAPLPLTVIFSNAELLLESQRAEIARAFSCPVVNTYGMGEIAAGATECQAGRMHLWPEAGIVEVANDTSDEPVARGAVGRMIVTGLLNADMPLVRYEVGDRGSLDARPAPCPCGRTLPRLGAIEGRLNDMIITPDGRRVFWLNPVFYGLAIREAQIIQEAPDRIRVRFVEAAGFSARDAAALVERLRQRVGDMRVLLEPVDCIPRGAGGKFRGVISDVHM